MKETKKEKIWSIIKGIALSELLALGLLFVVSIPIRLFLSGGERVDLYGTEPVRDFTIDYFIMLILYVLANYIVYIRKSVDGSKLTTGEKFDLKSDIIAYVSSDEGKLLLIIYGILAVVFEALEIFAGYQSPSVLLIFCFPIAAVIPVPVIRTIIAYIVTMALLLLATEYKRYRTYKYWNTDGKRR